MINKLWGFFIIIGIVVGILSNQIDSINREMLNSAKVSLDMVLQIFPVLALWLGIMNIAKTAGVIKKFAEFLSPLLGKLFPEIPKNHEALGYIASNIIVNMFGLGSAATPVGLKGMRLLNELNDRKDEASRSMITFLVINTSGVTIVPTTIISLRMLHGSSKPTEIVLACVVATVISTFCAIIIDKIFARRNKKCLK
ncbi:MAG: nucleoside recognition domain-containing protein [Bacilli bacterium]|nr:nucleoside recognition domain-containing protein [Bacilli bacterium]MDD4809302.1 nucleoside recognition domain-containing protein [Bacilli bacterium]